MLAGAFSVRFPMLVSFALMFQIFTFPGCVTLAQEASRQPFATFMLRLIPARPIRPGASCYVAKSALLQSRIHGYNSHD